MEEELALLGLSQPLPSMFSRWPGYLALFLLYYQCMALKQDVYCRVLIDALYQTKEVLIYCYFATSSYWDVIVWVVFLLFLPFNP